MPELVLFVSVLYKKNPERTNKVVVVFWCDAGLPDCRSRWDGLTVSLQQVLFYVGVTFPFSAVSKRPACCYEPVPVPHVITPPTKQYSSPGVEYSTSSISDINFTAGLLSLGMEDRWLFDTGGVRGGEGSTVVGTFSIKSTVYQSGLILLGS